jgi:2-oxo-4-hydroxy-4-carboxy-5-ureidoimidazoline decarboxylase
MSGGAMDPEPSAGAGARERRPPKQLAAINALSAADFVEAFGDIAEHSRWVAEHAAAALPFAGREAMITAFARAIDGASPEAQLALLNAHPDLAGRAAVAGDLAPDSAREQAGAGLDRLTVEEFARFTDCNARYRARFGHPFILAVKGATKHDILAAFAARIGNAPEAERAAALAEVKRIVRLRIEERVEP